jgi:hypothetical protein
MTQQESDLCFAAAFERVGYPGRSRLWHSGARSRSRPIGGPVDVRSSAHVSDELPGSVAAVEDALGYPPRPAGEPPVLFA